MERGRGQYSLMFATAAYVTRGWYGEKGESNLEH